MALGNMSVARSTDKCAVQRFLVISGTSGTAIKAGEPVCRTSSASQYVRAGGMGTVGVTSGDAFVGIALSTSDETTTVGGYVDVAVPTAGTVYRAKAKTKASLSDSLRLTKVVIDYTSPDYTIDESTTTNGFCQIVDFNSTTGEVDFLVDMSTYLNA